MRTSCAATGQPENHTAMESHRITIPAGALTVVDEELTPGSLSGGCESIRIEYPDLYWNAGMDGIVRILFRVDMVGCLGQGLTQSKVGEVFERLYGRHYSSSQIGRMIDWMRLEVEQWLSRGLESYYPVIFIDAIHVKVRRRTVENEAFYVVLGVTTDRRREVLAITHQPVESATGWQRWPCGSSHCMSWYMRCWRFRIFFSYLIVAQQSLTPEVPVWWIWVAGAIAILAALVLAVIVWIMAGRAVAATDHQSKSPLFDNIEPLVLSVVGLFFIMQALIQTGQVASGLFARTGMGTPSWSCRCAGQAICSSSLSDAPWCCARYGGQGFLPVSGKDHRSKRRETGLPSVTIYRCDVILACTAYEQPIHPLAARFP